MEGSTETSAASLAAAILAEADELIRIAAERKTTVRLAGSLAVRAQCPAHAPLLAEHEPGDTIDTGYIAGIMRKDWGFCHSTQLNLEAIGAALPRFPALPAGLAATVGRRAATLNDAIGSAPKTQKWKLRARLGDR